MRKFFIIFTFLLTCLPAKAQEVFRIFPSGPLFTAGQDVTVYPEGFVLENPSRLTVNGGRETLLHPGINIVILEDENGRQAQDTVRVIAAAPPSGAFLPRVLCVGESTTASVSPDPETGRTDSGWNWVSMMRLQALSDGVRILCLGTESLTGEAAYTAHGGWSSYTYLNWPCAAKMDPYAPEHFFKSETMWYALGLRGVTGSEFNGETWQYDLMTRTPFGKYQPDGDPRLWEFILTVQGRYGYPEFSGTGKYKGTPRQIARIREWAGELARHPLNEFYCLEKAQNSGNAFSMEAYLERYRTLDDNGIRLPARGDNPSGEKVAGSDGKIYSVGSRIVSRELLHKVSVCTPTQTVLNIGINDGDSRCSEKAAAEAIERLMGCFGGHTAAWFVNRWPGVCRKALWEPLHHPRQYAINGNNTRVIAIYTLLRRRGNIQIIDVWHCQNPASQLQEKWADGVLDCSTDDVHTGYAGQKSAAAQVLGWLYTTLQ